MNAIETTKVPEATARAVVDALTDGWGEVEEANARAQILPVLTKALRLAYDAGRLDERLRHYVTETPAVSNPGGSGGDTDRNSVANTQTTAFPLR